MPKRFLNFFIFFIFIFIVNQVEAQQFDLPKHVKSDSTTLDEDMKKLAIKVIAYYKDGSKENYFDNIFRYYIVSKDYNQSLKYLDSLRSLYAAGDLESVKGVGFIFEIYARAKLLQEKEHLDFATAFSNTFNKIYHSLSNTAKSDGLSAFGSNPTESRNSFYRIWELYNGKDSIDGEAAKSVIRLFNSFLVKREIGYLGKQIVASVEKGEYLIDDSVLIKMKDGAILSGIMIRKRNMLNPAASIFTFNIYAGDGDKAKAIEAANHGYAGVVINTRGKYLSPQNIEPFEYDASDAYDIIDWISKQPWSNGKVGMLGGSYLGYAQWAAVKKLHPALKTIVPQVSAAPGIDFPCVNHIFNTFMLPWLHVVSNNKRSDFADGNNNKYWNEVYKKWYTSNLPFRKLDSIEGRPNILFQRWLLHPDFDKFWQNAAPFENDFSHINIPILTTTGYYDNDQLGALYYLNEHYKYNRTANHYLVIGPFDHGGAQASASSEIDNYRIDSVANININNIAYQWFDYIMKDSAKPAILKDRINYEVMGANEWKHVPSFAKMNNDTMTLFFSNLKVGRNYVLMTKKPSRESFIRQEVDLANRDDIHQIESSESTIISNSDADMHSFNKITFITNVFEEPFSINGSILGNLYATINKKDMDISVSVIEQMPDGKYFNLTNSFIGRVSYSSYKSPRKLLTPGIKQKITISNNFFTSRLISKGSRLLIVLGIHKNYHWQINYGTGKDVSDETISDGKIPLQIKWHSDSFLKVPIWRDSKIYNKKSRSSII